MKSMAAIIVALLVASVSAFTGSSSFTGSSVVGVSFSNKGIMTMEYIRKFSQFN